MREKLISSALIACAAVAAVCATESELKWDTGAPGGSTYCLNVGAGFWFANDFDVSTLQSRRIASLKIMCCREAGWNNFDVSRFKTPRLGDLKTTACGGRGGGADGGWDGFRIGLFDFTGSTPGSIIWPKSGVPKFVKPSGPSRYVWCEFEVGWTLPEGTTAFAGGQEQFFLPPDCDLFAFDDDVKNRGHTWRKVPSRDWEPFRGLHVVGANFMLRVILTGDVSILPTSFGRVKALYH